VWGLIWAQSANGVIGRDGALPWRLPEDLRRFRDVTMGATVVMGRRTWESLPERFRPLPGRRNVVLSRDPAYAAAGATVAADLPQVRADGDVWVIGGAAVYAAALSIADVLALTDIDVVVDDGDVFAPPLGPGWAEVWREPDEGWHTSETGLRYRFRDLRRATGASGGAPGSPTGSPTGSG
jgi:dihydrofolate reductase